MIKLKNIYRIAFYFVILLTFVGGGFLQFFLGVPNTVLTLLIVIILFSTYIIYVLIKQKVVFNTIIFWSIAYAAIIIFSGIYNNSGVLPSLIYLLFPLLPISVFLFVFINYKNQYIKSSDIFKLFLFIGCIQLPIILIQTYFYEELIVFNNSGQGIASFDFLFGSFFVKSDHSLGLFLLLLIAKILLNPGIVKYHKLIILYLSITIFLAESNISKMFIVLLLISTIIIPLYKKYKNRKGFKIIIIAFAIMVGALLYGLRNKDFVIRRVGGTFEKHMTVESAKKQYELGYAKRLQIFIVIINELDIKWIGDGPYSYFDIEKGVFIKNRHFSQIIWTYFDFGILGLIVVFGLILSLVNYLNVKGWIPYLIFLGVIIVYSIYTTLFSDIAIMLSIMIIFNKQSDEFSDNTFPRLEKK